MVNLNIVRFIIVMAFVTSLCIKGQLLTLTYFCFKRALSTTVLQRLRKIFNDVSLEFCEFL